MEKVASARWRTVQGLTALLGNTAERWPRLGALQLAAAKQNLKLPGEGFSKALSDLPIGPIGKPGLLPPSQVFRGVTTPSGLQSSGVGYSKDYLHASPFKEVAREHVAVPQPYLGPMVDQPRSLIGVYDTIKNQKYTPNFGFESRGVSGSADSTKGVGYLAAKLQDLFRGSPAPLKSQMYETLVQPSRLQSVLLNNRVLPATAKGRELLQTGTMPAGAKLPPEILKSAGVTKEELIHAYKANDPAMRILSQGPVTDKDFLYHASGKKFDALDPKYNSKRSYGHEYTEPVVFAGDAPSSAFASNPTAEYQAVKDKVKDSVYHRLIDELTGRKALLGHTPGGYLYKLPASAFTRIDREDNELGKWNKSTEYVSHRPVKPVSVTPMQSTDVDAIPEYEYLGKDFVGEMPAQHYLKHAKNPKVIAAIQAWLANKEKSAGVFTASGNKVQGVGLRKLYHSLLDERGLTGLGVNNEDTGDVELSFDGDEAIRKEVFKELAARIRAKTNHPVTFAPTAVPQTSTPVKLSNKDSERLNAIHHLAYRMSNMYDPADSLMDPNDTFKQKLADRFRLQVNKGGLTGTVPSRAAEQLLGTRPMYAGMMPARRTRSEAEALSDMPMTQQQRLFKALKSGRGFLAPNESGVSKLASVLKLSSSDLPWRDRVEVYTQNPKGKIYGGTWDSDKSFALPGGGIDEGEDPLVAALRELKEETGITAKNPRLLPIDPVDNPWSDAHRAKVKRNFAGSRTHFVLADAAGRRGNKNLDVWNASNRGYYTPAEAIDIMNNNTNYTAPAAAAARLKALQHLQSLAMAAAKEKSAAPMNLYSYIPSGSIEHVKKHGLLSGNELAKPENRHLLDIARPNGDADRWLKEREEKLIKSPWANTYNGPSVLFGGIDTDKINDMHPIKKFNTTRVKINLHNLLKDYPATKLEGSELIPFSDTTYDALDEKGQNEFVNKRHHTLSLDEIKALLTRGQNPKDMWKDFKDTEGKYYASDVPHAKVVTPMGKIPSKYIEFK
jgi:ADP-ribose pyrophosphatase YjhB (NUDIX family)/acylphosphatase